jgi:hypothetical protein
MVHLRCCACLCHCDAALLRLIPQTARALQLEPSAVPQTEDENILIPQKLLV